MIIEMIAIGVFLTLFALIISMAVISREDELKKSLFSGTALLRQKDRETLESCLPKIQNVNTLEDFALTLYREGAIGEGMYENYLNSIKSYEKKMQKLQLDNIKEHAKKGDWSYMRQVVIKSVASAADLKENKDYK